ncbi:MAG: four helix bundle protein [Rhodanobacteraceae bacterium]|nr:four helix bundle protein [Rhodanobacteraceae bacterium]
MVTSYRDLVVWQKAMELAVAVYAAAGKLPRDEKFGLAAQVQRAVVSVPSNIAEGHSRQSQREFAQFLSVALGSLAESSTQVELAGRLKLLDELTVVDLNERAEHLRAMLLNLLSAVRDRTIIRDGEPPEYLTEHST